MLTFVAAPMIVLHGLPVQLTATTSNADHYSIDFDDGQSASGSVPQSGLVVVSHTYSSAGQYRPRVTVDGPGGSDSQPLLTSIEVQ